MSTLRKRKHLTSSSIEPYCNNNIDDNVIKFSNGTIVPIYAISKICKLENPEPPATDGAPMWTHKYCLNNGESALITKSGYDEIMQKIKMYKTY